jgi:hypothetical protein
LQLRLTAIADKLKSEGAIPQGFLTWEVGGSLILYILTVERYLPPVSASIAVACDNSVAVNFGGEIVPVSQNSHLLNGKLKTLSQLFNLMALMKNWHDS